ncbi:MAG: conjugal transfer protein TraH [Porticoccaceae bacterium]
MSNPIETVMGASINFGDLIDGGTVTLFRCVDGTGEDECLDMVKDESVTLTGFKQRFRDMLIGTTANMGIIQKLTNNIELSDEERAFLASTPFGGMLYKLTPHGETPLTLLVEDFIERLAFDMAYITVRDMVRAALSAVQQSDHAYATKLNDILLAASERIDSEVQTRAQTLTPASEIMNRYQNFLAVLPNKDALMTGGM